jgi:uncharacterized protein YbjT (DUF2867 family)
MFAVTGITGQVGGAVASTLLAKGCGVRAVVRDANKAVSWAKQGCEIAVADMYVAKSLETAFHDAEGVFVMLPPTSTPLRISVRVERQSPLSAQPSLKPIRRRSSAFLR